MEAGRVGRRVAYWRERRGLTQGDFGRLMAQSRRWVQDFEGGQRQADPRLSVLERASEVLRVPMEALLADDPAAPLSSARVHPPEVLALVEAMYRHDVLTGAFSADTPPPALPQIRKVLTYCCEAFQASHYGALGKALPELVIQSQYAVAEASPNSACAAYGALSRVYQLTASFLHKYGESTTVQAALAADRALSAAERSGDPVAIGAASRRVAKSLMYQEQSAAAVGFATAAARRLGGDLSAQGPLGLSTLGMLYLTAAIAASGQPRSESTVSTANDLLSEAAEVAAEQGGDLNEDWTAFGPTNVTLHRVDVHTRFEDGWSALKATAALNDAALAGLTRERHAQHLMTMARAALLARRRDEAAQSLLHAEQLAPEEVRGRPASVSLVKEVLEVTAIPSGQLRMLAQRCGLRA
ncbi:helix-turn-helix domain-containing protein [Streptomyces palmae]|uniref:XRE family transcriptional regulator n=1 Tax=Streptomyces palmae TaxID=1701085 RepID=A0A4Z0GG49_9ACTN|nr:helix-turn-helix transcriptional regulator [Streptomyces palmae]TGA95446.1 XRE family transcriptional regulator [Streptomyces palmae]